MSAQGSEGWSRARSDNPASSVVVSGLSHVLSSSRCLPTPSPAAPPHTRYPCSWLGVPSTRNGCQPHLGPLLFLGVFRWSLWESLRSEESYLLPRAPSADTRGGQFPGTAVCVRQLGAWPVATPAGVCGLIRHCFPRLGSSGRWGIQVMRVCALLSFRHPGSSDPTCPGIMVLCVWLSERTRCLGCDHVLCLLPPTLPNR